MIKNISAALISLSIFFSAAQSSAENKNIIILDTKQNVAHNSNIKTTLVLDPGTYAIIVRPSDNVFEGNLSCVIAGIGGGGMDGDAGETDNECIIRIIVEDKDVFLFMLSNDDSKDHSYNIKFIKESNKK